MGFLICAADDDLHFLNLCVTVRSAVDMPLPLLAYHRVEFAHSFHCAHSVGLLCNKAHVNLKCCTFLFMVIE